MPGSPGADAPVAALDGTPGWLLREIGREGFTALLFDDGATADGLARLHAAANDSRGSRSSPCAARRRARSRRRTAARSSTPKASRRRYGARPGTLVLLRSRPARLRPLALRLARGRDGLRRALAQP